MSGCLMYSTSTRRPYSVLFRNRFQGFFEVNPRLPRSVTVRFVIVLMNLGVQKPIGICNVFFHLFFMRVVSDTSRIAQIVHIIITLDL